VYFASDRLGADIAFCTVSSGAYKVTQVLREQCCPFADGAFWMLSEEQKRQLARLQREAEACRLALFIGAGVSLPSGLPSWTGLLEQLADQAGFSDEEKADLKKLSVLDQAKLIESQMDEGGKGSASRMTARWTSRISLPPISLPPGLKRRSVDVSSSDVTTSAFKQAIADITSRGKYTPAHAILGAMRLPACTTNYDSLLENAVASANPKHRRVMRLPWAAPTLSNVEMTEENLQLLKLHGCVSRPETIVLTRRDYMRYGQQKQALRGLVHSMLLMKEVLFVGFSMTDDNVHMIIDQVRQVFKEDADVVERAQVAGNPYGGQKRQMTDETNEKAGTILSLVENVMFRKLWRDDFHVLSCEESPDSFASGVWRHDCLLDCLAGALVAVRANNEFILDSRFASVASEEQSMTRDALRPLCGLYENEKVRHSPAWQLISKLLAKAGQEFERDENGRMRPIMLANELVKKRQTAAVSDPDGKNNRDSRSSRGTRGDVYSV